MRLAVIIWILFLVACRTEDRKGSLDRFRSQYHFTPPSGWMNDPNGLVYYEGVYHLFYQHYPDSTVWGPMHWGHAVSRDMVRWEHLPIALYPDSLGYIFSGSAVVDWKNSSGFATSDVPPLVAIFTYHNAESERSGKVDYQTQGIAYSLDKGRTWNKYSNNPVLANPGIRDFRDPKVSWNEVANKWVMALAVADHIEFYGSDNLKEWTKLSEFGKEVGAHGGVWECPDLFPLIDDQGNLQWVLFVSINPGGPQGGSATQYFIGSFDGKNFAPQDVKTRWIDYGPDNYAGVTWSDIPQADGRKLFIGWMSNWQYGNAVPTEAWRSANTLPREVVLNKRQGSFELTFKPVREITTLQKEMATYDREAKLKSPLALIEFDVAESEQRFMLTLSNERAESTSIMLQNKRLRVDRTRSGITGFSADFPKPHEIDLNEVVVRNVKVYEDLASIEIFVNDGERVVTEIVFPTVPYQRVVLEKINPQMRVSELQSIYSATGR